MKLKTIILILSLISFTGYASSSSTIKSSDYSSKAKRIRTLKKYFNLRSEIIDAHYEIYDVNAKTCMVPGATDRDYRIIVKIHKKDILKWTEKEIMTSYPFDFSWAEELLKEYNVTDFNLSGKKIMFGSSQNKMLVCTDTGIVAIRIVQH